MTDQEVDQFFAEYIVGFIFNDLDNTIQAGANYVTALAVLNYTEVLGGFSNGTLGDSKASNAENFKDGLALMKWNGNAAYYSSVKFFVSPDGTQPAKKESYKVLRCGLSHEYFIKGMGAVLNDPSRQRGNDPSIPGFGWKQEGATKKLFFVTNAYFRDFKQAFLDLQTAIKVAGSKERKNFEMAAERLLNRVVRDSA